MSTEVSVRGGQAPTFPVVGVGASAGGLEAFTRLLRALPPDTGAAYVLVQHLDPRRPSQLADLLASATTMPVAEAEHGLRVEPDRVYVITANTALLLVDGALSLSPREDRHVPHLPIDAFFHSLADDAGSRAVAVVLSGGGADGTAGLAAVKAAGGITFAQDPDTAHDGDMPRSAVAGGAVDRVLSPEDIAGELARLGRHPYVTRPAAAAAGPDAGDDGGDVSVVFAHLHARSGVDFSRYKQNTVRRRVRRRMAILGLAEPAELLRRIEDDPAEAERLFQDLLLRVTSFFRDEASFEALRKKAPVVAKEASPDVPVRVWVPGCSTGEEAYSIAITLAEHFGGTGADVPVKILATDVNPEVLDVARTGAYPESIDKHVSPERLRRFFHKSGGRYRINKSIRDLCVFARHNLLADPPFARIDLVSCRNVLIYFDAASQRRAVSMFHYALRPGGFLLLGPSETAGPTAELFAPIDRENSLHVRTLAPNRLPRDPSPSDAGGRRPERHAPAVAYAAEPGGPADVQREADRILSRYAPPAVLIDDNALVLHFRGDTAPFLRNPSGTPSLDLMRMIHQDLHAVAGRAISSSRTSGTVVRLEPVRMSVGAETRWVSLQVWPIRQEMSGVRCQLVVFEEHPRPAPPAATPRPSAPNEPAGADGDIADGLRRELDAAREYLQSMSEEYDATNEELKSANEEILASNEELLSTNEELQTAKEEMQAANEELETTNEELNHRNATLGRVNDDLTNLLSAAHLPLLMVGRDLRIRRFTAHAERLFRLRPADVGRPLREIRSALDGADLDAVLARVIDRLAPEEFEASDPDGRRHRFLVRPYETTDNRIDGAVVTAVDIDDLRRGEQRLRESRDFVAGILDTVRDALVVLDREGRVRKANRSFYRAFRVLPDEIDGAAFFEAGGGVWDLPGLRGLVAEVRDGAASREAEIEHAFPEIGVRVLRILLRPVPADDGDRAHVLLAIDDVTERRQVAAKMLQAQKLESLGVLAGGIAHDLNNLLTPILGYTDLVRHALPRGSAAVPMLDEVMTASRQAADLVQQILAYAGKGRTVVRPVDLGAVVRELAGLLRTAAGKTTDLRLETAGEPAFVLGDVTQLRQVVLNLVTNAAEAVGPAGVVVVVVRTGIERLGPDALSSPLLSEPLPAGTYAWLSVEDNGVGMSPETAAKIFDPFFTTKFVGRGLGLAAVQGIARGHRGALTVRSEPGKGSTFRLYLPAFDPPTAPPAVEPAPQTTRGSGTILVIDDEAAVLSLAAAILSRAGYNVLSAGNGEEGLALFHRHPETAAVLLDLTMPRRGGLEVALALRDVRPGVPVVLMSGYSAEEVGVLSKGYTFGAFLPKPFGEGALLDAIRRVTALRGG